MSDKIKINLPLQFDKVPGVKGYRIVVGVSSYDAYGYVSEEGHSNTVIVDQDGIRVHE